MTDSGRLLTTVEAGLILGVSDRRVRQLLAAQALRPTIVTPWGNLIERGDVERLAAQRLAAKGGRRFTTE